MNAEGRQGIRIVITGGGTAGWLSAHLLRAEAQRQNRPVSITLIESSHVPTVGVGEGTTSVFGGVLQGLGFDEREFLAETDATIKYGIRHRDWRRLGHVYDGPIDDAYALADRVPNGGPWIDTFCVAAGRSVAAPHLFTALMAQSKAPVAVQNGREIPVSRLHHAYHFDQAKVGAYLRRKATEGTTEQESGIRMIDGLVKGAERDGESGDITALILDNGAQVQGDFFVDCTGFRRALIGEVMQSDWVSYGDVLPVNRAMPFWLDLKDGQDLPAYTLAWAQKAGWMWQIPTQERMGCGYVYSDRHVSPDQAKAEIETVLGHPIEPRNDIVIKAGRLSEVWRGNVLALGLAASFLEPLEATSIHGTVVALLLFLKRHFAQMTTAQPEDRARFNQAIAQQVDDFRDFINLHYVSERDDSAFWRDVAAEYIQPATRNRLATWQQKMPGPEDFANDLDGLPHVEEQLHYPVLDGLGLLNRDVAKRAMADNPQLRRFSRETVDHLTTQARLAATQAYPHRDWLDNLMSQQRLSNG